MRLVLRGFLFRIIFSGAGFLVSLLIAKFGGAGTFGLLSLIIVNAAFLQILTGLGTDAAIVWHGTSHKEFTGDKIFSITVFTSVIQILLFFALSWIFFACSGNTILGRGQDRGQIIVELLYFTGLVFTEKLTSLFYSQHEAKLCNKILAMSTSIYLLILFYFWLYNPLFISDHAIPIYIIFILVPSLVLLFSFLVRYKPSLRSFTKAELRSFIAFSFLVFLANLIQFIAYRADFWIIKYFYTYNELGVYAQAAKFAQMLWIVPGILAGLIIPSLKNEKQKLTEKEFVSICRLVFYSHFMLSAILILGSILIYYYFLPAAYFNGFYPLLLMIPGYLMFIFTALLAAYFSANRLLMINLTGSVICAVLMIVFDLVLIPSMSYTGAAIANLLTYSITTFYFINRFSIVGKIHLGELFVLRKNDFTLFSGRILKIDNKAG